MKKHLMPRILNLTLKKQWFDMILQGEKQEEYREIKDYWIKRLTNGIYTYHCENCFNYGKDIKFKEFDYVKFRNGYGANAPTVVLEFKGIEIGEGLPEWGGSGETFIIKLGEIVGSKNVKGEI